MKIIDAQYVKVERENDIVLLNTLFADKQSYEIDQVNWTDFPYCPKTNFRIFFSDNYIFIRYEVLEKHILAVNLHDNEPVYEDSCVEFFVKNPAEDYYFNFEFNCIGTALAAKRKDRNDKHSFSTEEMKSILRFSSLERETVDNKVDNESWSLVVGIPFKLLGFSVEDSKDLMVNFYKCGDKTQSPHFLSWNPVGGESPNFHQPQCFGKLILNK